LPGTSPDGCSSQVRFESRLVYDRFDAVVLLSVPREVMFQRIANRSTNPFGKDAHERQRILADLEATATCQLRCQDREKVVVNLGRICSADVVELHGSEAKARPPGGRAGRAAAAISSTSSLLRLLKFVRSTT
jgi:hypothetical protein